MERKFNHLKRKLEIIEGKYHLVCCSCKNYVHEDNFEYRIYIDKHKNKYLIPRAQCKTCRNMESKLYHRQTRKKMNLENALRDIEQYPEKYKTNEGKIKRYLLRLCKNSAKNRNKEFSLLYEDIIIPEICPILNKKLILGDFKYTYSIDRINNNLGYIKGNIRVISRLANVMKNCATNEELIEFSNNIKQYIQDIV